MFVLKICYNSVIVIHFLQTEKHWRKTNFFCHCERPRQ